ncbi:MAG: hypothetical protein RI958_3099 [Actinomycetota bacterium]|jgi:hypothetical protein
MELTPTQQRLLQQLRRDGEPLVFDADFIEDLRSRAEAVVADASAALGGAKLVVGKTFLNTALGCEAKHLAPDEFSWNPATARGFVSHKAIELAAHWQGEADPATLVDESLARFADEPGNRGDFVASMTDAERAELRAGAIERTTRFIQDFPPLPRNAHPLFESRIRWSPRGTVELVGKTDLVVGKPDGRISTRLIIDFKTGWPSAFHRLDLRFYALVEALVRRVPPRRVATYYLDSCEADVEDVTEGILESTLARVEGAIQRHIEITVGGRPPSKSPSAACRWCPLSSECDEGTLHLRALADDGSQGFD